MDHPNENRRRSMSNDPLFRMTVEDVFSIRGRGTVATGHIEQGSLETGALVELRGQGHTREVVVVAIQMLQKRVERAEAGDYVGLVLQDIAKDEVQRGDVLTGIEWAMDEAE
jgi:elongation factor Tu